MADGADAEEVAKYLALLKSGGTIPSEKVSQSVGEGSAKPRNKHPKTAGRWQTLNDFWDYSARHVDTTAQAVWMILFRETKPNGIACVSHSQIATMIGSSRRTVVRATQHLEKAKLVTVVHRGGLIGGTSSYRVHGTPEGCDTSVTGGVTKPARTA